MKKKSLIQSIFVGFAFFASSSAFAACWWEWEGLSSKWVCDSDGPNPASVFRFHVKNNCPRNVKVNIMYRFANNDAVKWISVGYDFAPYEKGYLVDTTTRNIYLNAHTTSGSPYLTWGRTDTCWNDTDGNNFCGNAIDMGENFSEYTHELTCN